MTALRMTELRAPDFGGLAQSLEQAGLPTADLGQPGRAFFRFDADGLAGYGGLEGESRDRLLRSLVVAADRRGEGLGRAMLGALERHAAGQGTERLHLLTTTAAAFFRAAGYVDAPRADAPAAVAACEQFRSLCPASAAYLVKTVSL